MRFARGFKFSLLVACAITALQVERGTAQPSAPASYVGNAACVRCHEAIARSYAETLMARSSGEVKGEIAQAEFRHPPSGIVYRVQSEAGSATFFSYERAGEATLKGKQQLHYFIGSNAAGRSYLFSLERFLFQSPVTFYAQAKRWDVSPGYEADREMRMSRPIDANCLFCHASQAQPIYGTQNRFADPPFKHAGVSCERCHGPASLHVAGQARLINPAKLDPARRDSICAQCHLSGVARVERLNKRLAQFRPGDLLSDYVSYFAFETSTKSGLKVNSHVENMAESRCKQQSGERMSCLSCHDPHSVPPVQERTVWFRNRCLQCHQAERLPGTHDPASDCASCHMPKSRTVDGGHGVMTDHRIPRLPRQATVASGTSRRLVPLTGYASDERLLGLAYAEAALVSNDQFYEAEALRLLTAALKQSTVTNDAELLLRLAFIYSRRGDQARAARAYEAALQADPHRTVALVNLGGIYAAQGKIEEAINLWQEALERNAGLTEAAINLAQAHRSLGKLPQARTVLQRALRFDPDSDAARRLLKEIQAH
jgi:hypothetical protein